MSTYSAEANAGALNGLTDVLNNGFFRMLNAGSTELAKLTFSSPAFSPASETSPSVAQSTAIAPDASVTPGDIARYELQMQTGTVCISGTVGVGSGFDLPMASVTIPPTASSVSCPGGFTLTMQLG